MRAGNRIAYLVAVGAVALVVAGCPLAEDQSADSAKTDANSDVTQPDESLLGPNEQDNCSPAVDSSTPDAADSPSMAVTPGELDFGGVQCLGEKVLEVAIESCGAVPLELYGIALSPESNPDFSMDLSGLAHEPSPGAPLTIPPGTAISVQVVFAPTSASPVDDAGQLVLFEAAVLVDSNAGQSPANIPVQGASVTIEAPVALIDCEEGNEVVPGTVLHLCGNESYEGCEKDGIITKWQWEAERPQGSSAEFQPSASVADPTFKVDLAGIYTFYLVVYDESNTPCCFPAEYQVWVVPQADIHIELFWHTPGDADETDIGPEAGADLDLHLQHPFGLGWDHDGDGQPDCWMDVDANCFWFNLNPDWGEPGPENDPKMLFDDTDGAGPEVITLDNPEDLAYLVGVYYWKDHDFGDSWATVRVFVEGELAGQAEQVQLTEHDIWTVFRIDWPTGEVTLVSGEDGGYAIQPDFKEGYFGGDPETCGPF